MKVEDLVYKVDRLRKEMNELGEDLDTLEDTGSIGYNLIKDAKMAKHKELTALLKTDVSIVDHTSESHPNG